ncbi:MAG: hypothetical protein DMG26_18680, partial [Acidobacteria bacterium]
MRSERTGAGWPSPAANPAQKSNPVEKQRGAVLRSAAILGSSAYPQGARRQEMTQATILVVEGESIVAQDFESGLESMGYDVPVV